MKHIVPLYEFVNEGKSFQDIAKELVEIAAYYTDVDLSSDMTNAMKCDDKKKVLTFYGDLKTMMNDEEPGKIKEFEKEASAFLAKNKINESINEAGYVEALNPDDLQEAIDKIASVWTDWKKGPATKSSDINPARKELLAYIEKQLK